MRFPACQKTIHSPSWLVLETAGTARTPAVYALRAKREARRVEKSMTMKEAVGEVIPTKEPGGDGEVIPKFK